MINNYADQARKGNVTVIPVGKKIYEACGRAKYKTIDDFWNIGTEAKFENIKKITEYARKAYLDKEFDKVVIIYNQFKNAATQILVTEQHLPIAKTQGDNSKVQSDFIFEPNKEALIQELLPKILNTQLYKAVLDSIASEHGARMSAMDKATENAEDLLRNLKISYNRARQAAITTELTEIVSGAAALNG